MILYSIISQEDIFYEAPEETKLINKNGCWFEVKKSENGNIINRIISTNPNDYLKSDYDIGNILN